MGGQPDKDRAAVILSIVAWNVGMYAVKQCQLSLISLCVYVYLGVVIGLKLGLSLHIFPETVHPLKVDVELAHERINAACEKLHSHLKGWSILLLVWGGVKLAVYGRLLGTLGVVWVAVDIYLVQKAVRIYTGVELITGMFALRQRLLSAVVESVRSIIAKVRPETGKVPSLVPAHIF